MDLSPAPWEDGGTCPLSAAPPSAGNARGGGRIAALAASLSLQRQSREVGQKLRSALRDASAEFSYVRQEGLRRLLQLLTAAAASRELASLFRESQLYQELQVLPVLLAHSLRCQSHDSASSERQPASQQPSSLSSSSSSSSSRRTSDDDEEEMVMALKLLQGACLIDPTSRKLAVHLDLVKIVLDCLDRATSHQAMEAAIGALSAALIDSPGALEDLEAQKGLPEIAQLLLNRRLPPEAKEVLAEFILLLVDHILPSVAAPSKDSFLQDLSSLMGPQVVSFLRSAPAMGAGSNNLSGSLDSRLDQFLRILSNS